MGRNLRRLGIGMVLLLGISLCTGSAWAQNKKQTVKKVQQLNTNALKALRKKKVDVATERLNKALALCAKKDIKGRNLSTTYLHLGVVEADGNQNNAAAMDYFKLAVCTFKKVNLKFVETSAETKSLFKLVKKQVKKPGQCPDDTSATGFSGAVPGSTHLPPGTITQTDLLFHQSVVEQQNLVPVPIYVEVNPSYPIGEIVLYYRTMGERIFQKVPMTTHGKGHAATIGCDVMQTFNPSGIEYYIGVMDQANQLLGTSGTEAQPHMVAIVETLSGETPALPDSAPPGGCAAECPPWDPSCNQGCKPEGVMCDSSQECCSGVCVNESCAPADGSESKGDSILRIGATFGSGIGVLPGAAIEPYNQVSLTPEHVDSNYTGEMTTPTGVAWNKFNIRASAMFYLNPKFLLGVSFRGGLAMDISGASEVKTIAPTILANVAFRILGEDNGKFEMTALVGFGGGVIQYRIPYKDCREVIINDPNSDQGANVDHPWYDATNPDGYQTACHQGSIDGVTNAWDGLTSDGVRAPVDNVYFRRAGNLVGELGIDSYIWFVKGFGLNIGLIADAYFVPDFALNIDLQIGPVFRF